MWANTRLLLFCLIAGMAVSGCARAQSKSPEEELAAYASKTGGEWIGSIASLQGKNTAIVSQLGSLSLAAREKIGMLLLMGGSLEVAPELSILPTLSYLDLSMNKLRDIGALAGLRVSHLVLADNPIVDISILSSCTELQDLTLVNTRIKILPDLSRLQKLKGLGLSSTPLRSLKNIETIPHEFDLDVMRCDRLTDLDALRSARVRTLYIDEKNYARLKPWFDAHVGEIKKQNPKFNIQFSITE